MKNRFLEGLSKTNLLAYNNILKSKIEANKKMKMKGGCFLVEIFVRNL
jgi:hypothetical protein